MTQKKFSTPYLTLSEVMERIEKWRKTPNTPRRIPEELWEAAASLSKDYSIHRISKALGVNYSSLKQRVLPERQDLPVSSEQPLTFIELGIEQPSSISECIVEMEDGSGAKMRMHFRGKTDFDLLELGKAFWRKEG